MKTKFKEFVNESFVPPYVDLKGNLYNFFEGLGMEDVNIVMDDNQSIILEFLSKPTTKEEWWDDLVELCKNFEYDKVYIDDNKVCL